MATLPTKHLGKNSTLLNVATEGWAPIATAAGSAGGVYGVLKQQMEHSVSFHFGAPQETCHRVQVTIFHSHKRLFQTDTWQA